MLTIFFLESYNFNEIECIVGIDQYLVTNVYDFLEPALFFFGKQTSCFEYSPLRAYFKRHKVSSALSKGLQIQPIPFENEWGWVLGSNRLQVLSHWTISLYGFRTFQHLLIKLVVFIKSS